MSGDACATKTMTVEVQENGIIRDAEGWIIGRLCDDIPFEELRTDDD